MRYFVSTTGDDTKNGQTRANAFRTVGHALGQVVAGDSVAILPGFYVEDTGDGRLNVNRSFASPVVFGSESGILGDVTLQNADGAYGVYFNSLAGNVTFQDLDFVAKSGSTSSVEIRGGSDLTFSNTRFTVPDKEDACWGLRLDATSCDNCRVLGSSVIDPSHNPNGFGMQFSGKSDGMINGLVIDRFVADMHGTPLILFAGLSGFLVQDAYLRGKKSYGAVFGRDGDDPYGLGVSGDLVRVTADVSAGTGHGLLIGTTVNGMNLDRVIVKGGDYGVVAKKCFNVTATRCRFSGGTAHPSNCAALYVKGGAGIEVTDSDLDGRRGDAVINLVPYQNPADDITLLRNKVTAYGIPMYSIDPNVTNMNIDFHDYRLTQFADFGSVLGTPEIQTLAELQGVWAGAGSANDANSTETRI